MRGEAAREGSDYCERQRRRMAREAARRKRQRKRLLRFIIVLLVMSFVTVLLAKATTGMDDKRPEEAPVPTAQQMAVKLENPAMPAALQPMPTQTPVAIQVTEEPLRYIGEFRITHYCACERCCGKGEDDPWYGITATGSVATEGRTIAVDPDVIPYGSRVAVFYDDGRIVEYVAEDCGGAIDGLEVDVFIADHDRAWALGVKSGSVYIVSKEG